MSVGLGLIKIVNVAIAANPTQISTTKILARWVTIQAAIGNAGTIYHGDSSVAGAATGHAIISGGGGGNPQYPPTPDPNTKCYDLRDIYLAADTLGDAAVVLYMKR